MRVYQVVDADYVERERGLMPLVDVRPPLLYDAGHIPTALNVRLDVAAASDDPAETLAELFRGDGIFRQDRLDACEAVYDGPYLRCVRK